MTPETLETLQYLGVFGIGFASFLGGEFIGRHAQKAEMLQRQLKGEATQIGDNRFFLIEEAHFLYLKQQAKAFQDGITGAIKARRSVAAKEIQEDHAAHPEQYEVRTLREVNQLSDRRFRVPRD